MGTNPATAGGEGEDPLAKAVVEFIEGERGPQPIGSVAACLEHLGKHSGGVWPRATADQWREAIREAGTAGSLIVEDGRVRVPVGADADETDAGASEQFLF